MLLMLLFARGARHSAYAVYLIFTPRCPRRYAFISLLINDAIAAEFAAYDVVYLPPFSRVYVYAIY